jgi:hypothetical protein
VVVGLGGDGGVGAPQSPAQPWNVVAQFSASDCAAVAQSWRHGSRSAPVPQPVTHERIPAATPRAHSPSAPPHAPRQAAASLPIVESASGVGGVQLPRQPWRSSRHDPVTLPRNVSAQPRMQPPKSAGAAFVRQSVRQASFTRRAVLIHAAFAWPQPAWHCWSCARAAGSARNAETPTINAYRMAIFICLPPPSPMDDLCLGCLLQARCLKTTREHD